MIHGESYKPIVAEAAKAAIGDGNLYERVFISHLLTDADDPNKIAGAVGFSVRENVIYVFKAKAVICSAGGAVNLWRPHAVGEGLGRAWYTVFNTGSVYSLMIQAGAEMTQMEHRLVQTRFKDGYGPVGMYFLMFKTKATNAYGEEVRVYSKARAGGLAALCRRCSHADAAQKPPDVPRHPGGQGPHLYAYCRCAPEDDGGSRRRPGSVRWKARLGRDFLDMTVSQALLWASNNIDPAKTDSGAGADGAVSHGLSLPVLRVPGSAGPRMWPLPSTSGATTG